MSEALEQMLEEVKPDFSGNAQYSTLDSYAVSVPKDNLYGRIDSYVGGTLGLYSFDFDPNPFGPAGPLDFMDDKKGLQDPGDAQRVYPLGDGYKVTLHGPDENTLQHGHLKFQNNPVGNFDSYSSAILDYILSENFSEKKQ